MHHGMRNLDFGRPAVGEDSSTLPQGLGLAVEQFQYPKVPYAVSYQLPLELLG